jgi:hypothetical protein
MANAVQAAQSASEGWLSVPWIIWAGVLSASIASLASWLTSRSSAAHSLTMLRKQHEHNLAEASRQRAHDLAESQRQREHDSRQKDEDRKGEIRRAVYAEAVEKTHALLGFLGALPDHPLNTGTDTDCFQAFLRANAKVWLVADAEAAHLSRDLASDFGEVFLREVAATYPLRLNLEPVRRRRVEIAHAEAEVRRIASQLTDARARQAPQDEQERWSSLAREAAEYVGALEEAQQQALLETVPARIECFKATFRELRSVQRSLCKLVSALRAELNLPRDDDEFLAQLQSMENRAWTAVNRAWNIDPPLPMPETQDQSSQEPGAAA